MGLKAAIFVFQVESSDLIAYGLIPEFIGRFPILVSLTALTEDQLVQVTHKCTCIWNQRPAGAWASVPSV